MVTETVLPKNQDDLLCLNPLNLATYAPIVDHYVDLQITTEGDAGRL